MTTTKIIRQIIYYLCSVYVRLCVLGYGRCKQAQTYTVVPCIGGSSCCWLSTGHTRNHLAREPPPINIQAAP